MINNINTFQNKADVNLASATEKYIIEALANLGQRYSIKGDGITIEVRTLYEMLASQISQSINANDNIFKVFRNGNNVNISLLDNNLVTLWTSEAMPFSSSEGFNQASFNISVAETEAVNMSNLYMYSNDNHFTFSGIVEGDNRMFVCEKYDKYANTLDSSVKVIANDGVDGCNAAILYLYKHTSTKYLLKVYHIAIDFDNAIEAISQYPSVNGSPEYTFTPTSFLAEMYRVSPNVTPDLITEWNMNVTTFTGDETTATISTYVVDYNPNDGSFVFADESGYELINETGLSNVVETSLAEVVEKYSAQLQNEQYMQAYVYKKLKTAYSNEIFKSNPTLGTDTSRDTLFLNILKYLFLYTYNENDLYIPVDYEFEFAVNTNNPWQIYYSTKDIALHDVSVITNTNTTISRYKDASGLIRIIPDGSSDVEKTTFYSFYVEPDPESNDDIYNINISKHFTMPYISGTGYWVVDDIETAVYAKGKDAGNPNITIVKSDFSANSHKPEIRTTAKKDYMLGLPWVTDVVKIELPKQIVRNGSDIEYRNVEINGSHFIDCEFFKPNLDNVNEKKLEEYLSNLEYCIILNMTPVTSIQGYSEIADEVNEIYGPDGILMTFWTLQYNTNKAVYEFMPMSRTTDNNGVATNVAVDVAYMTDLYNIVGYTISNYIPSDPDNFMFTQLVFDNVNYQYKNRGNGNDSSYTFPAFPVIKAVSAVSSLDNQQLNNFNLKIEYNDTIDGEYYFSSYNETLDDGAPEDNPNANKSYTYTISSLHQSADRRWFDAWTTAGKQVSNEIYAYGTGSSYLEYLPNDLGNSVPMLDLSEIFVKDNTSLNRVGVVSFDSFGNSYYSYIGTTHDTEDKSYLTIGTTATNINIGTDTLVNDVADKFLKQSEMHIDFDNTRISSYAYVQNDLTTEHDTISLGTTWRKFNISSNTYWTTTFRQVGKFESSYAKLCSANSDCETNINEFYEGNNAFIAMTVPEQYENSLPFNMYINDMISVPNLIKTLCPTHVANSEIIVESDNDVISYIEDGNTSYIGVRLNSSMQKDIYSLEEVEGQLTGEVGLNINTNKIYTSNELEITYYVKDGKHYFTINDMTNNNTMSYIHKLKDVYNIVSE